MTRVTKARRLRWAGNFSRMGERRGAYRALVWEPGKRDHLLNLGVDDSVIFVNCFLFRSVSYYN
jgi:hypothetical protein